MRVLLCAMLLLFPFSAGAVNLCQGGAQIILPNPAATRSLELCDELRILLRVRAADFTNQNCAEEFLRIGLRAGERQSTTIASQQTVTDDVRNALATFDANFPVQATIAFCGDNVADSIGTYVEPCDDGGVQTALCEVDCRLPECGDAILNTFAGEVCDDGNTDDGDGCNSTCTGT